MYKEKITIVNKDDLVISWFNNGQKGGQHSNRHNNCCRIYHPASGVTAQCTDHKSAPKNRSQAFLNLTKHLDFKLWLAKRMKELNTGKTIEEVVKEQMHPKNLKIEILEDGQWTEIPYEDTSNK